jgi:hypothetical protein
MDDPDPFVSAKGIHLLMLAMKKDQIRTEGQEPFQIWIHVSTHPGQRSYFGREVVKVTNAHEAAALAEGEDRF